MFVDFQAEDNVAKGKLRMAVEDFKAALALDPSHTSHNVHLHLGLCKVLVKLGRGKEAISSCTEALNIDEELVEALVQVCFGSYAKRINNHICCLPFWWDLCHSECPTVIKVSTIL